MALTQLLVRFGAFVRVMCYVCMMLSVSACVRWKEEWGFGVEINLVTVAVLFL